jgi:outer membrane protein OmpA-like peptidoglycan-associated protein
VRFTLALAAALMLAGCSASDDAAEPSVAQEPEAPSSGSPQGASPDGAAPSTAEAPAPGSPTIGTRSSLSSQTSALTGSVTDFRVTVTDMGTTVELATDTLFEFDKAELGATAIPNLQRVADMIRSGGTGTVTTTGHTDSKGDDAYNQALSQRRAQAVATWLRQQQGTAGRTFSVIGKGETVPVTSNTNPDGSDNPEGRARNRRVQVDIPRA